MTYVPRTEPRQRPLPKGGADGFDLDVESFCIPAAQKSSKVALKGAKPARAGLQTTCKGVVKYFSSTRGYGLIEPSGGGMDVYVFVAAVEKAGIPRLRKGEQVCFNLAKTPDERPSAINLKRA